MSVNKPGKMCDVMRMSLRIVKKQKNNCSIIRRYLAKNSRKCIQTILKVFRIKNIIRREIAVLRRISCARDFFLLSGNTRILKFFTCGQGSYTNCTKSFGASMKRAQFTKARLLHTFLWKPQVALWLFVWLLPLSKFFIGPVWLHYSEDRPRVSPLWHWRSCDTLVFRPSRGPYDTNERLWVV